LLSIKSTNRDEIKKLGPMMKIWGEITCGFFLDIHFMDFLGFAWLASFYGFHSIFL
jgi:hypothetical protein